MIKKIIYTICSVCLIFAFTGCGGSEGHDAPSGATITISGTNSWTDTTTTLNANVGNLYIVVKNANGVPLNNVKLRIFFPLARSNIKPTLFDATNNDGGYLVLFFDEGDAEDSPMEVTTDINGVYELVFTYWSGGVTYSADFVVTSGNAIVTHEFEVTDS